MLTKGLGRGGTERLLTGVARHVDRSRFRIEVAYLLPWKDAFLDEIEAQGIPVHCLNAPRPTSIGWLGRLRKLVRSNDIQLVHTHAPLPAAMARVGLGGKDGPALVHTEHNQWGRYRRPTRWANAATYWRNGATLAVSDGVAASIRSRVPTMTVVHGIDVSALRNGSGARRAARSRLGLPDDVPVVGTVGNFTPKKDQATLLRAFAAVAGDARSAAGGDARLVLLGSGPLEDGLRRLARQLEVDDLVHFLGMRDDVFDLLPGFDLFALSSRFEGLPISLLEAMGSGVAPVVTDVGGVPEVVTHGRDGVLVPPGDHDSLAAALSKLLSDRVVREHIAAAARSRAADFDITLAVRTMEAVYDTLLDGKYR